MPAAAVVGRRAVLVDEARVASTRDEAAALRLENYRHASAWICVLRKQTQLLTIECNNVEIPAARR